MASDASLPTPAIGPRLASARRDALVLAILITAVLLLIWNGSAFFQFVMQAPGFGPEVRITATALTLNVALILFGWRRYVDLQHEAERRAEHEQRVNVLATTDQITGLYNRKGFADRADDLRLAAAADGRSLAVLSFQIHRFKSVNDQHGFEIGDRLLKRLAAALGEQVDADAILARLSGDEFAVALALSPEDLGQAEARAEALLHAITRPFMLDERVVQVGAFAGMAVAPAAELRIPSLLRRADIAMDHARSGRVARPLWFDAGMERALIAHGEIEQGIRYGLDHGQFVPFFEPQIALHSGEIIGFEVLARWSHPLSGIISPGVFIPVAEEIGLIGQLSEQVIGQALLDAADWDAAISLSVNISPVQLTDSWLAQRIVKLLSESGFPASRLVVEVTESSLFENIELARTIVTSLKNQGIRLALDDFGTGFSSLSHLRSLPFDIIKIDRSFITNLHAKRENMAIVRAVKTLAGALSVPVCVEGIECEAVNEAVIALGCEIGQGWYFGKPMPAAAARALLDRSDPKGELPGALTA